MKDDAQLIDEALAGNSASFGQLVTKYQDRLYNTIAHVVGCKNEAYDVVQDAFVQAFLKLPPLKALAPTQTEPPFAIAQAVNLVAFLVLGYLATKRFQSKNVHASL